MKILQNYKILNQLDVPTIEWKQYYDTSMLEEELLWTIKLESKESDLYHSKESKKEQTSLIQKLKEKLVANDDREKAKIGVTAKEVKEFVKKNRKYQKEGELFLYYPYYTVVESGIIDINYDRVVIEAVKGTMNNLVVKNKVDVTLIFKEDDLQIEGEEYFFTKEEMLPLIDYSKNVRKMVAKDIDMGKNIQLYFSYFYKTSTMLEPVGEKKLLFYKFKIF